MTRILIIGEFQTSFFGKFDAKEFEFFVASSGESSRIEGMRFFKIHLTDFSQPWSLIRFFKFLFNEFVLFFELSRIIHRYSISMVQVHSLSGCLEVIPACLMNKKSLIWVVGEQLPLRRVPRVFFAILSRFVFRFLALSRYVARNMRILGVPRYKIQQMNIGLPVSEGDEFDQHAFKKVLGMSQEEYAVALVIKSRNHHILESLKQALSLVFMQFEHVKIFVSENDVKEILADVKKVTTYKNLSNVLKGMDLLVHIGIREPFPFEILEAMALGVAVVAPRSGAIPELVVDRRTGILVPPQDARSLAKAITELLSDMPLRQQMGRESKKRVAQYFRPEDQIRTMKLVYRQAQEKVRQLSPF